MRECTNKCEHCQQYNDDWCVCWHPRYKGSRKQMSIPCLLDIDKAERRKAHDRD